MADYTKSPLVANDALTGQPIKTFDRVTQIWVKGEEKVRSYETPEHAFSELKKIQADGKRCVWFIAKIISPILSYLLIWHGMPQTKQDKFKPFIKR